MVNKLTISTLYTLLQMLMKFNYFYIVYLTSNGKYKLTISTLYTLFQMLYKLTIST